jgi:hypothetical protein
MLVMTVFSAAAYLSNPELHRSQSGCIFLELCTQSPGDFPRVDALGGQELDDYPLLVLHQTHP